MKRLCAFQAVLSLRLARQCGLEAGVQGAVAGEGSISRGVTHGLLTRRGEAGTDSRFADEEVKAWRRDLPEVPKSGSGRVWF